MSRRRQRTSTSKASTILAIGSGGARCQGGWWLPSRPSVWAERWAWRAHRCILGATFGDRGQRRLRRLFGDADQRVLMVAGAAAGVAAIFKAPATGAIFALEVPYQDDVARRMLLPALVSAATSYVAFVAVNGTDPLFRSSGSGVRLP